ncbi:aldehyde oxidase 1-like isoform X5 [Oncorhynchus keta]|uniref:aldehyde oxidase 1-like isoform X5 n=1 Tax=Oncorhynchus keta TaxID=8018 RepID=UPI0015FABD39|nr:aldehyde oxidase 1-like isoform X5 [Oncorhynchus keta]
MSAKWHILLYSLTVPDPVGRPIMHRSAFCQATGEAVYRDDIPKTDKELHLVLVTSTRPHSNILTGRAVRCVRERGEEILITGARQPVLGKHQVGFMNDGRIMAADLQYYANSGNTADESLLAASLVHIYKDGSDLVSHGGTEMGQGIHPKMQQEGGEYRAAHPRLSHPHHRDQHQCCTQHLPLRRLLWQGCQWHGL